MANSDLLAKLRHDLDASDLLSIRPDKGVAWAGLSCVVPAAREPSELVGSIEERLEEASSIVQGLLETATTLSEHTDLLRVLELLRR